MPGMSAIVATPDGKPLLLLPAADPNATPIMALSGGVAVVVTRGPDKARALTWWHVRSSAGEGWVLASVRSGTKQVQTLLPLTDALIQQRVEDFAKAIANRPDTAAYIGRGLAYYNQKDPEQAIADFSFAISLSPDEALAYYYRGLAYDDKQDFNSAIADFTQAIALRPNEAAFNNSRCLVDLALNNYRVAVADCSRAIEINAVYATAYNNRGLAYKGMAQQSSALDDFSQAIKIDPDYAAPYRNRGLIFRERDDNQSAIADLSRAVELDPDDAASFRALGDSYFALQKYDEARTNYHRYLDLTGTPDAEVTARLNEIQQRLNQTATPAG